MDVSRYHYLVLLLGLIGWSGCDATRELVKAPFDATTAVSNGTTQATGELTQPSKEFTSSTTPGSVFRNEQQLKDFIAYNFQNLQADIAQAQGEHVTSLATLAGIPANRHRQIVAELQTRYSTLYPEGSSPSQSLHNVMETLRSQQGRDMASQ